MKLRSRGGDSSASATRMPPGMKRTSIVANALLVAALSGVAISHGSAALGPQAAQKAAAPAVKPAPAPDVLDKLLAPIALYPDALLGQMLLCASNPGKVAALQEWLASHGTLKGTDLQDAATKSGFEPSFVALVLFPQVVDAMAERLGVDEAVGKAFAGDRTAVFASIQRLRDEGQGRRHTEDHAAAGRRDSNHVVRPAGDRHRAGQPAGRLRAAVQPAGRLYAAAVTQWSSRRSRRRASGRGGSHRVYRRHRDRRGDGQRLLLRSVRMARRRLHVQRRVGRLLRRS